MTDCKSVLLTENCMQSDSTLRFWTAVIALFFAVLAGHQAIGVLTSSEIAATAQQAVPTTPGTAVNDDQPRQKNYLEFFFNALGVRYTLAFLVISFTFVAFLVMNLLGLRRDAVCPPHLAAAFETQVNENKLQEAFDLAKNDDSMLGQMLAAGMQNVQSGYDKAELAMSQVGEDENLKLEHRLSFLSLVGTIAPMVGLLGTVDGMVLSFMEIASQRHAAQAQQAGRRHFDGPDHDARGPGARDSRHHRLQPAEEPPARGW